MRSARLIVGTAAACLAFAGCGDDASTTDSPTTTAPGHGTSITTAAPSTSSSEVLGPVTFRLTIENTSGGAEVPTPLAPGLALLHDVDGEPIFTPGEADRGEGLEALAEDGDPTTLAGAVDAVTFQAEEGGYESGPLLPGAELVIELVAQPGQRLTIAAMFGQSNDWFFAALPGGIELFGDDGVPIAGDVTAQVALWDAGTEADQPIGEGSDQAPRQAAPNMGDPDPDDTVRRVSGAQDHLRATLTVVG